MKIINTFLRCCCLIAILTASFSSLNAQTACWDNVGLCQQPACNDNGTPYDITDDFVEFGVSIVNGTGSGFTVCTGTGFTLPGTGSQTASACTNLFTVPVTATGANFTIKDDVNPACTQSVLVPTTAACSAPGFCPTLDLEDGVACDNSAFTFAELAGCSGYDGVNFEYDLWAFSNGTSFDGTGYTPSADPTTDPNLVPIVVGNICGAPPTVNLSAITTCDVANVTFYAYPFDLINGVNATPACGIETVNITVFPELTVANVVGASCSSNNVSAELIGSDGTTVCATATDICTGTDPLTLDFSSQLSFDPALAPGCNIETSVEVSCNPQVDAPIVDEKNIHCAGKQFAGITADCGNTCTAPPPTTEITSDTTNAPFELDPEFIWGQTLAFSGIPDGAIIENITVTVAIDQNSASGVGNMFMGVIAPNGATVPLQIFPGFGAAPGLLSSDFPITFDDNATVGAFDAGAGLNATDVICQTDGICDFSPEDPLGIAAANPPLWSFFSDGTSFLVDDFASAIASLAGGSEANGDWVLVVADLADSADFSQFQNWSLNVEWFIPSEGTNWYAEDGTTLLATGDTFMPSELELNTPGVYTYFAECFCGDCTSELVPTTLVVADCECTDGCTYLLVLEDEAGDGWDAASIDVSVNEAWPADRYKMTPADGNCKVIPICVGDGGTIDLTYWNGANENEHSIELIDPLGFIASDITGTAVDYEGNIPVNQQIRVKSECPDVPCAGETEDFIIRITMGDFPEEQSWEIYEGPASSIYQGNQVFGINASAYTGLAPGFQIPYNVTLDKCTDYTFVAFDGFNDSWNGGNWELITSNINYGTEIIDPTDSQFGNSLVLSLGINGDPSFIDEDRVPFTVPCESACSDMFVEDSNAVNCEVNVTLPIATPEVCFPNCNHATGCDITVEHIILPNGVDYLEIPGGPVAYTGQDSLAFGLLPVGCHKYVTKYTYCDGVIAKCTADLNIVSDTNPTLVCNDNVQVTLGNIELGDDDNGSEGGISGYIDDLGECVVRVTPDMVLEDPNLCVGEYSVTILDENDNPLIVTGANGLPLDALGFEILPGQNTEPAHDLVGPAQEWQTLKYVVEHKYSGNKCWGTITVEDKLAPEIFTSNYNIRCTHPEALNEFWSHTDVYEATSELPANIAGGNVGLQSNTYIPINMDCAPMGEVIQNIQVNLNLSHTDVTDLQVFLHLPQTLINAGYASPIQLDDNGDVGPANVYTPNPVNDAPGLLGLLNAPCMLTTSTSPEDFVTETSGANFPANLGGTWYIQVVDNDTDTITNPDGSVSNDFDGGEITAASITLTCGFPFPYAAFDCNLTGVDLLSEMVMETDCDQSEWLGAQIVRVWQATDKTGRTSTATQTVGLKAPMMDEIAKPADVHLQCTEQLPEDLTPEVAGVPTFGCFPITETQHGLCDITYSYEDQVLATCGDGFKIIRTWTIVNWCSQTTKVHEQLIKVEDTEGPVIGQGDETAYTASYDCGADISLNDLGLSDNCSGISSVTASYTEGAGAYLGSGTLVVVDLLNGETIDGLPSGSTDITITAKDGCFNVTEKVITITVEDNDVPIAICNDELHVSLGGDGEAWLSAEDVDEGSYDNCGSITLEVRRVDGCIDTTAWANAVPFSCCDKDQNVTVELRVTDSAGNTNTCWKTVLVEDALAPVITCAPDKTIDCNDPAVHAPFGDAIAVDNCEVETSYEESGELDQCYSGTLTRTYTATDNSDKSLDVTCTQRVTVEHVSDFIVQFPSDRTLNNCELTDTGMPIVTNDDCELIAMSHEDLVLDIVSDACYKIERTWTIVNWCVYDADNAGNTALGEPQPLPNTYKDDGDGYFQFVQTIKVLDDVAPVFDSCPDNLQFCDLTEDCEGYAELTISAEDACSPADALEYTYKIDAFNDGSFDIVSEGNNASGVYPYGTHRIKWVVEDGCGNTSSCSYLFTIEDCKNPTPVCLNGISIENMQTGCVDVWASDLLEYAFDNCTERTYQEWQDNAKIRREGDTSAPQGAITLCCEDLGTVIVEIWVEDEAGNADYCTTYIVVQDNQGACPDSGQASVAGSIYTDEGDMVEDVMVDLDGAMTNQMETTENGQFAFDVNMHADYTVTPTSDNDPLNGVSTFDLVLMSQHILGFNEFTSPYTMIAADVNNDGNVTTFDIVQLRQMILYIITDFPTNTSWRFVDSDYSFPVATNPWYEAFPERIEHNNLSSNEMQDDFIAVKIGDVNGDVVANSLVAAEDRNMNGTLVMSIDDAELTAGNATSIDFRASDFDAINGFQYTMTFDANAMQFAGVEAGALNVTDANFGLTMLNEGIITTSWNTSEAAKVANDEVLFTLNFEITNDVVLSEALNINSRYTSAEAYSGNDYMDVAIAFSTDEGTISTADAFELFQNTPNPFNGETVIGFNLPEAATATLKVSDVSGKILKVIEGDFAKGYNTINLNSDELKAAGVLYYQLDTPNNSATKKMIILE